MKKYKKAIGYVGVRKIVSNGHFEAIKKIKGRVFSKTFPKIQDAVRWRNTFNPFENKSRGESPSECMTFSLLWEKYEALYFPQLENSSQVIKRHKMAIFYDDLKDLKLDEITPEFLEYLLEKKKGQAKANPFSKRCNFSKELKEIKAALNWYRENYDYRYHNPVLKRHHTLGIIKRSIRKEKVLNQEQLINFFKAFDDPLFQDFALVQFFCASRFGEIAGIQLKNLDLLNKMLLIKEVVVEDQSKRFLELKPYPKNGHPRPVAITSRLFEGAITRRLVSIKEGCNYLFHLDGRPLKYRLVQYHYNKALTRVGLFPQFSSTHILRYSMATESRRIMGSLDAAQAMTGHHSIKMIEHYAQLPTNLQNETISKVGDALELTWKRLESLPIIPATVGKGWEKEIAV